MSMPGSDVYFEEDDYEELSAYIRAAAQRISDESYGDGERYFHAKRSELKKRIIDLCREVRMLDREIQTSVILNKRFESLGTIEA